MLLKQSDLGGKFPLKKGTNKQKKKEKQKQFQTPKIQFVNTDRQIHGAAWAGWEKEADPCSHQITVRHWTDPTPGGQCLSDTFHDCRVIFINQSRFKRQSFPVIELAFPLRQIFLI